MTAAATGSTFDTSTTTPYSVHSSPAKTGKSSIIDSVGKVASYVFKGVGNVADYVFKGIGICILGALFLGAMAIVLTVASVVSAISLPILAIAYFCVGIKYLYHNQRTKNAQGLALHKVLSSENSPTYKDPRTIFNKINDLSRLEHEKKRLECDYKLEVLKDANKMALSLIIPIIGLIVNQIILKCKKENSSADQQRLDKYRHDCKMAKYYIDNHIRKLNSDSR